MIPKPLKGSVKISLKGFIPMVSPKKRFLAKARSSSEVRHTSTLDLSVPGDPAE